MLRESNLRKIGGDPHSEHFFGRQHTRGLALQYSTAKLHMHQLFIKYRKMDRYLQDITGWRVKLNTEHSPEGVNSAHVES